MSLSPVSPTPALPASSPAPAEQLDALDHDTLDHDTLLAQLEDTTLPSFSHRDHVRAAWLYLRRKPFLQAIEDFGATLRAYAASKGADGLYHETITWAFFLLIRERLAVAEQPDDWQVFVAENPDLLSNKPSILERYYHPETLASPLARRIFVLPDRAVG